MTTSPSETIEKAMEGVTPGPTNLLDEVDRLLERGMATRQSDNETRTRDEPVGYGCFDNGLIFATFASKSSAEEEAKMHEGTDVYPLYLHPAVPDALALKLEAMQREMAAILDAEALSGIRALVAGWNGEHLPENERFGRHHDELGVKLPTTCGAIYALDEAMTRARTLIQGEKK